MLCKVPHTASKLIFVSHYHRLELSTNLCHLVSADERLEELQTRVRERKRDVSVTHTKTLVTRVVGSGENGFEFPPSSSARLPDDKIWHPFLSLDCARVEGVGAQSKERKGSNFAA